MLLAVVFQLLCRLISFLLRHIDALIQELHHQGLALVVHIRHQLQEIIHHALGYLMGFLRSAPLGIQLDEIGSLGILDIQVGLGKILHCRLLIHIHISIDTGNNRLQHRTGFHDFDILPCLAGSRTGHGCQCRCA